MMRYHILLQVHNYMSARLPSVANLANQVKAALKSGTPRKKWPPLALLPGDIKDPSQTKHRPNFVAYQVQMKSGSGGRQGGGWSLIVHQSIFDIPC